MSRRHEEGEEIEVEVAGLRVARVLRHPRRQPRVRRPPRLRRPRPTVGLHATWLVNSATHLWGKRRFETKDDSRNNWWVAILTGGEGWHNNHHAHPVSARHGLAWYEFDVNYYGIWLLEKSASPRKSRSPSSIPPTPSPQASSRSTRTQTEGAEHKLCGHSLIAGFKLST